MKHKFCYICGSENKVTFHHFNNKARKNPPKGVLKKDGEEGITLCRKHHDKVEEYKTCFKLFDKIKKTNKKVKETLRTEWSADLGETDPQIYWRKKLQERKKLLIKKIN